MKWARYVKRMVGTDTQIAISDKVGVDQTTISRWMRGVTVPDHAGTVAYFAQVYNGNVLEAFVAADLITPEQAGMPPADVDFYTLVDEDDGLSDQAKIHLKNQYGLLRAASAHARNQDARDLIQNDPELDQATKARLLAHLGGNDVDVVYSTSAIVIEHPFPRVLSERDGRHGPALAADPDDDAAGESESYNEP